MSTSMTFQQSLDKRWDNIPPSMRAAWMKSGLVSLAEEWVKDNSVLVQTGWGLADPEEGDLDFLSSHLNVSRDWEAPPSGMEEIKSIGLGVLDFLKSKSAYRNKHSLVLDFLSSPYFGKGEEPVREWGAWVPHNLRRNADEKIFIDIFPSPKSLLCLQPMSLPLSKFLMALGPESEVTKLFEEYRGKLEGRVELKIFSTREEFRLVYQCGPRSCMSGSSTVRIGLDGKYHHPAEAYCYPLDRESWDSPRSNRVAIAYSGPEYDPSARAIILPDEGKYIRVYGDDVLKRTLRIKGYSEDRQGMIGLPMAIIPTVDQQGTYRLIAPYTDGCNRAGYTWGEDRMTMLVADDPSEDPGFGYSFIGTTGTQDTSGVTGIFVRCPDCNEVYSSSMTLPDYQAASGALHKTCTCGTPFEFPEWIPPIPDELLDALFPDWEHRPRYTMVFASVHNHRVKAGTPGRGVLVPIGSWCMENIRIITHLDGTTQDIYLADSREAYCNSCKEYHQATPKYSSADLNRFRRLSGEYLEWLQGGEE